MFFFRIFISLFALSLLVGELTAQTSPTPYPVAKKQTKPSTTVKAQVRAAVPAGSARVVNQRAVPTRTVGVLQTNAARAASTAADDNDGAPAGILSSTPKTPGRPTATNYAKLGRAAGQTATETLREMRRGYAGLTFYDLTHALHKGGYDLADCYRALQDLGQQPYQATALFRRLRYDVNEVARGVASVEQLSAQSIINILNAGGYSPEQLVEAGRSGLRMPADLLLKALNYVRADIKVTLPSIRDAYNFTEVNVLRIARQVGVAPPELERLILTSFRPDGKTVTEQLAAAELSPERIVAILHDRYKMGAGHVARRMKGTLGLPVEEAARLLRKVYHLSPADAGEILLDAAKYNYERTKQTLSKLYNMSLADVVRILSPWH